MIGVLICIGIYFLRLLACGIVLSVGLIQYYKWEIEFIKRWGK